MKRHGLALFTAIFFIFAAACTGSEDTNGPSDPNDPSDPGDPGDPGDDWDDAMMTGDGWALMADPENFHPGDIEIPNDPRVGKERVPFWHDTSDATLDIYVAATHRYEDFVPDVVYELGRSNDGHLTVVSVTTNDTARTSAEGVAFYRSGDWSIHFFVRYADDVTDGPIEDDVLNVIDLVRVAH